MLEQQDMNSQEAIEFDQAIKQGLAMVKKSVNKLSDEGCITLTYDYILTGAESAVKTVKKMYEKRKESLLNQEPQESFLMPLLMEMMQESEIIADKFIADEVKAGFKKSQVERALDALSSLQILPMPRLN